MYANKKLTVIGRTQPKADDVEVITAENHRRRMAAEEANAWMQFTEERERRAKKTATRRVWLQYGTYFSFAIFGASVSATAVFMALGVSELMSASLLVLIISAATSLCCASLLDR
jgi:hypothetical protein